MTEHFPATQVLQAVLRHIDWSVVKCLVIAGPGFAKDQFKQYMESEAVRRDIRLTTDLVFHLRSSRKESNICCINNMFDSQAAGFEQE